MAAVDCDVVWKLVFGRFPAELFNDPFLAHELLRFLRLNLESLQLRVPEYTHFFPNLLKVKRKTHELYFDTCPLYTVRVVWKNAYMIFPTVSAVFSLGQSSLGGWFCGSAALSGDTRDCSGASSHFVGPALSLCNARTTTQVDMRAQLSIKTILSCQQTEVCVCLSVCYRSTCLPISEPGGRGLLSLDAFRSPSFRGLFLFLLRAEAGTGKHMSTATKQKVTNSFSCS